MEKYNADHIKPDLHRQKMRVTRQRKAILELLKNADSHPTADWIYERVRTILPNISLGTVYHNLGILEQQGFIRRIELSNGPSKFDGRTDNHYHVTCIRCGRYDDINLPIHPSFETQASSASGYQILFHQLTFKGVCPSCSEMEDAIAV